MENTRFLKIAVLLLLLLNIGTLTFMWIRRPPPPGGGPGPFNYLVRATGMDDLQREAYARLRDAHHSSMERLHDKATKLRQEMFGLLSANNQNDPAVGQLADSIAAVRKEEELVTFRHFQEVRKLCRPDQQQKFDEAIAGAIESMGAPMQPGPPPERK